MLRSEFVYSNQIMVGSSFLRIALLLTSYKLPTDVLLCNSMCRMSSLNSGDLTPVDFEHRNQIHLVNLHTARRTKRHGEDIHSGHA